MHRVDGNATSEKRSSKVISYAFRWIASVSDRMWDDWRVGFGTVGCLLDCRKKVEYGG